MQQEQFINLANIESHGAGIRIPRGKWNSQNIQASILRVLEDEEFKKISFIFSEMYSIKRWCKKMPQTLSGISLKIKNNLVNDLQ